MYLVYYVEYVVCTIGQHLNAIVCLVALFLGMFGIQYFVAWPRRSGEIGDQSSHIKYRRVFWMGYVLVKTQARIVAELFCNWTSGFCCMYVWIVLYKINTSWVKSTSTNLIIRLPTIMTLWTIPFENSY